MRKPIESHVLPGMEADLAADLASRSQVQAELLSEEFSRPLGNISDAAGRMERDSPLFYGKGENASLFE